MVWYELIGKDWHEHGIIRQWWGLHPHWGPYRQPSDQFQTPKGNHATLQSQRQTMSTPLPIKRLKYCFGFTFQTVWFSKHLRFLTATTLNSMDWISIEPQLKFERCHQWHWILVALQHVKCQRFLCPVNPIKNTNPNRTWCVFKHVSPIFSHRTGGTNLCAFYTSEIIFLHQFACFASTRKM